MGVFNTDLTPTKAFKTWRRRSAEPPPYKISYIPETPTARHHREWAEGLAQISERNPPKSGAENDTH